MEFSVQTVYSGMFLVSVHVEGRWRGQTGQRDTSSCYVQSLG